MKKKGGGNIWSTPGEIREKIMRLWDRGDILSARIRLESPFPLTLSLRRPGARDLLERFGEVREWIRSLEEGSQDGKGLGYRIVWTTVNHRILGRNRIPLSVVIPTESDALHLIGRLKESTLWQGLFEQTLLLFPALSGWFLNSPMEVLDHLREWDRILAVLGWFSINPRPGLYLRQLDIPGVDSKFIESRRKIISELLDWILPENWIDQSVSGARGFERRYGLLEKPALLRFRLLSREVFWGEFSDMAVRPEEFSRSHLGVNRVFITENEINGLAFPDVPKGLVIFGLGYGVDRLADVRWLSGVDLFYWGDIDTHGFAILDRLRSYFPNVRSFLMDRETLFAHRPLWGHEPDPFSGTLARLTPSEESVFELLKSHSEGPGVRLEQERIPFGWVQESVLGL